MRLKPILLALTLATSAALAHAADVPTIPPQMLMGLMGLTGGGMGMATSLSPQQTAQIASQIQTISQQTFTPAEQAKLAEFQNSPEGASIIAKLPQFAQAVAPVLMQAYMGQMFGGGLPATTAPAVPAPVAPVKPQTPKPLTK